MSNAPYLLDRARSGYRMGHGRTLDHMFLDGLEDAYDKGRLMGTFAEDCAEAISSPARRRTPTRSPRSSAPTGRSGTAHSPGRSPPVSVKSGKTETLVSTDEQPPKARPDKIPTLKPAFREGGTVTAANSSSISDGAAALVMMRAERGRKARRCAAGEGRRARDPRRRAEGLSDRADRRPAKAVRQDRLEPGRGRPLRDQRGLRGRRDGGDARPRAAA